VRRFSGSPYASTPPRYAVISTAHGAVVVTYNGGLDRVADDCGSCPDNYW